uniref:Uncharacterized protein n=1 Tax=Ehrlichia ruminantium TaxID=779 RepID=Q93FS8_EHRRU|nr:unknown [Ehrlichia ruminantium]
MRAELSARRRPISSSACCDRRSDWAMRSLSRSEIRVISPPSFSRARACRSSVAISRCSMPWAKRPMSVSTLRLSCSKRAGTSVSIDWTRPFRFWAMRRTSRPIASTALAERSSDALTCSPMARTARSIRSIRPSVSAVSSRRIISARLASTDRLRVSASFSKRAASREPSGSTRDSAARSR